MGGTKLPDGGTEPTPIPTGQALSDINAPDMPHAGAQLPRTASEVVREATAVGAAALAPNYQPDLSNQLVCDHRTVQALFSQFNKFVANAQEEWMLKTAHAICVLMRVHSQGELDVVYPLLERVLPDGGEVAAKARAEHGVMEQELAVVDCMQPHAVTPEQRERVLECPFVKAITKMSVDFTAHIQDEELCMLPALAAAVTPEDAAAAATVFDRTKQTCSLFPGGVGKEL